MEKTSSPTKNLNDDKGRGYQSDLGRKAEDAASQFGQKANDAASNVGQKAQDAASQFGQKAHDAASNVGQKAQDAASNLGHKAHEAASNLSEKAEHAGDKMGSGLQSLGHAIREHAPEEGMVGHASSAVADKLEQGGRYLQEQGMKEMAEDVTNLVRRNPIPALVTGVAVGYLLGRAAR